MKLLKVTLQTADATPPFYVAVHDDVPQDHWWLVCGLLRKKRAMPWDHSVTASDTYEECLTPVPCLPQYLLYFDDEGLAIKDA